MQRAQLGVLAMRGGGWHRKPDCVVGQNQGVFEIELGVVAESRCSVGCRVAGFHNRKFALIERCCALAGAVGDLNVELRVIIIEHRQNQGRPRLRARMDVVGEMAPDQLACRGLWPPDRGPVDAVSIRLERTDRLRPCGTTLLICSSWAAVSAPLSASYCGSSLTANSCSAMWMAWVSSTPRWSARRLAVSRVTPKALSVAR